MATDYAPIDNPHMTTDYTSESFTLATVEGVYAIQSALIRLGYLDPPVDGGFGSVTKWALAAFASDQGLETGSILTQELKARLATAEPLPLKPGEDVAGKIVRAMLAKNLWVARHPDCVNIAYIEGMNLDGSLNDNQPNVFNDLRTAFKISVDGTPVMLGIWDGTTEPGKVWTDTPMDPGGAFHIRLGQYKAWVNGTYHTVSALLQAGELKGYRDPDKTYRRDYDHPVHGSGFGVHQHHGYDLPKGNLGRSSAGCLVGRLTRGHLEFMALVLADPRHQANPAYRFISAILDGKDVAAYQSEPATPLGLMEFSASTSMPTPTSPTAGLPQFTQDVVDLCSAIKLKSSADVKNLFGGQDNFFNWYNATMKGVDDAKGRFPCRATDRPNKLAHFDTFWDQIPTVFGPGADVTALEFAALMAVNLEENNGDFAAAPEEMNGLSHPDPGLAYAFDHIQGLKQSYNQDPNRTALDLFKDSAFVGTHSNLAGADIVLEHAGGIDRRWGGDTWPSDVPANVDPSRNGFIMEADFYKFRGRGVIQTTWRSDYELLIRWLLDVDPNSNSALAAVASRWKQATKSVPASAQIETIATISTNADWDTVFAEPLALAQGIVIDSKAKNNYLTSLARNADALEGTRKERGSFRYFAAHINGGDYPDRVHLLMRALARGIAASASPTRRAPRAPDIPTS